MFGNFESADMQSERYHAGKKEVFYQKTFVGVMAVEGLYKFDNCTRTSGKYIDFCRFLNCQWEFKKVYDP